MTSEKPQGPAEPHPFGRDYEEERDPRALAEDRARVRRQADALLWSGRRQAFDRQIFRAIVDRRSDRDDIVPIDIVRSPQRGVTPVVRGEVLVRSSLPNDDPRLWESLTTHQFDRREVERLDNRLLRLSNPSLRGDELDEISRFVRSHGAACSVNHVPALAPMVKGEGGPEPTRLSLSFPPTFAAGAESQQQVRVAVVDTGIAEKQRTDGWLEKVSNSGWLNGVPVSGVDPLDALPTADGFLDFAAGHGTFAAGIVQRVAPQAEVMAYRALDSDGIGSELDIACAIVQAAEDGANIINLSLGVETLDDQPLLAIETALDIVAERSPDVLVVAAAGNTGGTRPVFPGASRRVVAVAGLNAALAPAAWSTRGWWVDCSTIGEGVVSTYIEGVESSELDPRPDTWDQPNPWALWTGSSFAAPQISGAVARLCAQQPGLTPRAALKQLLASGRRIPDFGAAVAILPGT